MITAERIAELRRLLAGAMPGPWGVGVKGLNVWVVDEHGNPAPRTGMRPAGDRFPYVVSGDGYGTTLECIAATHNALPELLDAAERIVMLQAELDVLRGVACEEGQAAGRGRCGVCVTCLRAACARKDSLLMSAAAALHEQNTMLEEVGKR